MNETNTKEKVMETQLLEIKIYDPKKYDDSRQWFHQLNQKALVCVATGISLSADPRYADRGWSDNVPHPKFLKDCEREYPGHIFVFYNHGMSYERLMSYE
jgi:hypothetical protein